VSNFSMNRIQRVNAEDGGVTMWPLADAPCGLSMTRDDHLLVTFQVGGCFNSVSVLLCFDFFSGDCGISFSFVVNHAVLRPALRLSHCDMSKCCMATDTVTNGDTFLAQLI